MGNVSFISEIITEFNYRHDLIKKKKKKPVAFDAQNFKQSTSR